MIQVLHELAQPWPLAGPFQFEAPAIRAEIQISPELAQRRAKGYLTSDVAMAFRPCDPVLVWGAHPVWRMSVVLHLRGFGQVAVLGSIDVDAMTGTVYPLSAEQITKMQERADAIASRLTPETASGV